MHANETEKSVFLFVHMCERERAPVQVHAYMCVSMHVGWTSVGVGYTVVALPSVKMNSSGRVT